MLSLTLLVCPLVSWQRLTLADSGSIRSLDWYGDDGGFMRVVTSKDPKQVTEIIKTEKNVEKGQIHF